MKGTELSVTYFSRCRLELVHLCITLAGDLSLRRLPVKVGPGAVVQGSVHINPNRHIRISRVSGGRWRFSQTKPDQDLIEERQLRCRRGLLPLWFHRNCGGGSLLSSRIRRRRGIVR